MKKVDMKLALEHMKTMNPWTLRKMGRQAGLKMFRELIAEATDPRVETILQQCYMLELKIIKTCQDEDQDAWDVLNAEQKELFAQIKLLEKETAE